MGQGVRLTDATKSNHIMRCDLEVSEREGELLGVGKSPTTNIRREPKRRTKSGRGIQEGTRPIPKMVCGGLPMKTKGDTYLKAFAKWRELRGQEIIDLKNEVHALKQLVEWLCHEVMKE